MPDLIALALLALLTPPAILAAWGLLWGPIAMALEAHALKESHA